MAAGIPNKDFWEMTPRDTHVAIRAAEYREDKFLTWATIVANSVAINGVRLNNGAGAEGFRGAEEIYPRWSRWRNDN